MAKSRLANQIEKKRKEDQQKKRIKKGAAEKRWKIKGEIPGTKVYNRLKKLGKNALKIANYPTADAIASTRRAGAAHPTNDKLIWNKEKKDWIKRSTVKTSANPEPENKAVRSQTKVSNTTKAAPKNPNKAIKDATSIPQLDKLEKSSMQFKRGGLAAKLRKKRLQIKG